MQRCCLTELDFSVWWGASASRPARESPRRTVGRVNSIGHLRLGHAQFRLRQTYPPPADDSVSGFQPAGGSGGPGEAAEG